ncbi:hypothetical protein [Aureliella helgolandensis]|uniref:Uncharacterized protein n=1 Tax=Aureliella helgolandensis TaxID=2527968 RepID=A0A518GB89_9BACT|nr:hypothetical protein [Aureliella helgolandensis]QDV25854.1 hypothetical protein Q31a_41820 [Aureliella helgolandensis]
MHTSRRTRALEMGNRSRRLRDFYHYPHGSTKYTIRSLFLAVFVVAICCPFVVLHFSRQALSRKYMQQNAIAYAICRHLSEHDYEWPKSWAELEPSFDLEVGQESPWTYEELRSTVSVRFDIDGPALAAQCRGASQLTLDAFRADDRIPDEASPNRVIVDYIKSTIQLP